MMRRFIFFFLTLVTCYLHSNQELKIIPHKSWLCRSYDIYASNQYVGSVKRELLHINTIYSVSDKYGECGRGIDKLLSLSTLSKGFKKIKIFDERDKKIGYILGNFLELRKAQYTLTNEKRDPIAVAHLSGFGSRVIIAHPRHRKMEYARFERIQSQDSGDYWKIDIIDEEALDHRFFYIFAAFVADAYWPANSIGTEPPTLEDLISKDR